MMILSVPTFADQRETTPNAVKIPIFEFDQSILDGVPNLINKTIKFETFLNKDTKYINRGQGSLGAKVLFPASDKPRRLELSLSGGHKEADFISLEMKIFIPEQMKGAIAIGVLQSDAWNNWAQTKPMELVPGWNTLQIPFDITKLEPGQAGKDYFITEPDRFKDENGRGGYFKFKFDPKSLSQFNLIIEMKAGAAVTSTFYVDSVEGLVDMASIKVYKLANTKPIETRSCKVLARMNAIGGSISSNLMSINGGTELLSDDFIFQKLKEAGHGAIRLWGFPMGAVSLAEGKYDFTSYDKVVDRIRDMGWDVMPVMGQMPDWLAIKEQSTVPKNYEAWGRVAGQFVKRYNVEKKYNLRYWEIWNEPEYFWTGTYKEMLKLTKIGSEMMKKSDPSIKVVVGAWASPNSPRAMLPKLSDTVDKSKFDAVSYHHYICGGTLESDAYVMEATKQMEFPPVEIRKIMAALKFENEKEIICSESSVNAGFVYDKRIDTVFWPVFWASALHKFAHQNVQMSVYFSLYGVPWGMMDNGKVKPVYYLWPLFQKKADILGKEWVGSKSDVPWVESLVIRKEDVKRVSIILINKNPHAVSYDTEISIKDVEGLSVCDVYQLNDNTEGIATLPQLRFQKQVSQAGDAYVAKITLLPYTVTVIDGAVSAFVGEKKKYVRKIETQKVVSGQNGQFFGQGDSKETVNYWGHSWIGSGNNTIVSNIQTWIPTSSTVFHDGEINILDVPFFDNSSPDVNDSLLIDIQHNAGGWASCSVARPAWVAYDASDRTYVAFAIRSDTEGIEFSFNISDNANNRSLTLDLNTFLPAGQLTGKWQIVKIPFSELEMEKNIKLERVQSVNFILKPNPTAESAKRFRVYVDNIVFGR